MKQKLKKSKQKGGMDDRTNNVQTQLDTARTQPYPKRIPTNLCEVPAMETDDAEIKRSIVELLRRNIQESQAAVREAMEHVLFNGPRKEIIEGDGDGKSTREDA